LISTGKIDHGLAVAALSHYEPWWRERQVVAAISQESN